MDYKKYINEVNNTITDLSEFICDNGVSEYQVMIHITQPNLTYQEQLAGILNTFTNLLTGELKGATAVFKRYFLSDAANQADTLLALTTEYSDCALSVVEQPPLNGTKIALWAYLQTNVQTRVLPNGLFESVHGNYPAFLERQRFQSCSELRISNAAIAQRLCNATHGTAMYTGKQLHSYLVFRTKCRRKLRRSSKSPQ